MLRFSFLLYYSLFLIIFQVLPQATTIYINFVFVCLHAQSKRVPLSNNKFKGGIQGLDKANFHVISSLFFSGCRLNNKIYILRAMYLSFRVDANPAGRLNHSNLVEILLNLR